jgi:hypothetical protein
MSDPLAALPSRLPLPGSNLHAHLYFLYFLKVLALASDTYIRPNIKQTSREPDGASDRYTRRRYACELISTYTPRILAPLAEEARAAR